LISPKEGTLTATSSDHIFNNRLQIATPVRILSVQPALAADKAIDKEDPGGPRRFLLYPGGTVPKITIEIANERGRKRLISIDPITGVPQSNVQNAK